MIDVARLRKFFGLSQAGLAERLGVNQSTISRLEAGGEQTGPILILLQRMEDERLAAGDGESKPSPKSPVSGAAAQ